MGALRPAHHPQLIAGSNQFFVVEETRWRHRAFAPAESETLFVDDVQPKLRYS